MQTFADSLFQWVSRYRNRLMTILLSINWLIVALLFLGSYSVSVGDSNSALFSTFARKAGEYAALFFVIVSIPGIARRFRFSHKLIMIISMYRRQLGVLTYLLIMMHALILRIIPWVTNQIPPTFEAFVVAGSLANMVLFTLFVTSNDWSVKKLHEWWGKIHTLIYIAVWFIFLHLALRGVSIWSVLIGITAVLQLTSHLYAMLRQKGKT